jgi:hypothetical protein
MFYVYQYIDPRTRKIFYIGKGSGDRKYDHLFETLDTTINKRKFYKIKSIRKAGLEPIIEEIQSFDKENDAYAFEEYLIKLYGRKGYDSGGILSNITIGINPPSRKGKTLTAAQRQTLSGRKLTEEQKLKLKGRTPWNKGKKGIQTAWNKGISGTVGNPMTEKTKQKLREKNLGKKKSKETKLKMSKNMKGRIPWNKDKKYDSSAKAVSCIFISPEGITYSFPSFRKGCLELRLPTDKISQVNTGKLLDYKGWIVKALNNLKN